MATLTVYSDADDAYLQGSSFTYSTAANTAANHFTSSPILVGQSRGGFGNNFISEAFLAFDTSALPDGATIEQVDCSVYVTTDLTGTDFTAELRAYDWGTSLSTGDWVAPADLPSQPQVATLNTSGLTTSAHNAFSEDGTNFRDAIDPAGTTRLLLNSSRHRTMSQPGVGDNEYFGFSGAETSGTTQDPVLTIAYSTVAVVAGSADLSATGSLVAAGDLTRAASATLSGSGSLTAAGQATAHAAASLSGAGALSAAGRVAVPGSASLSGAGTLAATAVAGLRPHTTPPVVAVLVAHNRSETSLVSANRSWAALVDDNRSQAALVSDNQTGTRLPSDNRTRTELS